MIKLKTEKLKKFSVFFIKIFKTLTLYQVKYIIILVLI